MSERTVTMLECDVCKPAMRVVILPGQASTPPGWRKEWREIHDCGLTGYTQRYQIDVCPSCAAPAPSSGAPSER